MPLNDALHPLPVPQELFLPLHPPGGILLPIKHDDIIPLTEPKLDHIPIPHLQIPRLRHLIPIQHRPIRTLKINKIRLDLPDPIPELIPFLHIPKLDHSVLLTDTGMLSRQVHHRPVPPHKPTAPQAQLDRVNHVLALEHEHLPLVSRRRLARLGRLVVLQRDGLAIGASDRVSGSRQRAGGPKVRLLLLRDRLEPRGDGEIGVLRGERAGASHSRFGGGALNLFRWGRGGRPMSVMPVPPR